jgi:hypothetical protein
VSCFAGAPPSRTVGRIPNDASFQPPPRAVRYSPLGGPVGVPLRALVVIQAVIPVRRPFSHIACHIKQSKRIGLIRSDRRGGDSPRRTRLGWSADGSWRSRPQRLRPDAGRSGNSPTIRSSACQPGWHIQTPPQSATACLPSDNRLLRRTTTR